MQKWNNHVYALIDIAVYEEPVWFTKSFTVKVDTNVMRNISNRFFCKFWVMLACHTEEKLSKCGWTSVSHKIHLKAGT